MPKFGPTYPILRATRIFPALPGAARWRSLPPNGRHVACRDGLFLRPSNIIRQPGRRSSQHDEQKIREKIHVLVICSGCNRPIAISAREFVLHDVFVVADNPGCPGKFVLYRICGLQSRLLGAKLAWLTNRKMTKFWPNMPNPEGYANFSGPAGGRSLALAAPLWQACGL